MPNTLAIVDRDPDFSATVREHLLGLAIDASIFTDAKSLLTSPSPFSFGFYLLGLDTSGIRRTDVVDMLRQRTDAGIVILSSADEVPAAAAAIYTGADMHLERASDVEQISLAIQAIQRRAGPPSREPSAWSLELKAACLVAPNGQRAQLTPKDLSLMACFLAAGGHPVTRAELCKGMSAAAPATTQTVTTAIFRLKRRARRGTALQLPVQAKSGLGYQFCAPLVAA